MPDCGWPASAGFSSLPRNAAAPSPPFSLVPGEKTTARPRRGGGAGQEPRKPRLAAILDAGRPRAENARQRDETIEHQLFFLEILGERVDGLRHATAKHARAADRNRECHRRSRRGWK